MSRHVFHMDVLDSLLDAAFRLVVGAGDLAPSLRALAAEAGMSPAGVVHHFGSRVRALLLVAGRWSDQQAQDLPRCRRAADLVHLVPATHGQVQDAAFDLALTAVGHAHEGIAMSMSRLVAARRQCVATAVPELDEAGLDLVAAVVDGLVLAMTLPRAELSTERAKAAFELLLSGPPGVTSAS